MGKPGGSSARKERNRRGQEDPETGGTLVPAVWMQGYPSGQRGR